MDRPRRGGLGELCGRLAVLQRVFRQINIDIRIAANVLADKNIVDVDLCVVIDAKSDEMECGGRKCGLVERELADKDDTALIIKRAGDLHFVPGLIVRGIHPGACKVDLAPGLIISMHTRIRTNQRRLTIFMNADLSKS